MNKKEYLRSFYNNTPDAFINQLQKNSNKNLRLINFCVITKKNDNGTINAKPIVAESVSKKDGEEFIELPELLNVLVYNPKFGDEKVNYLKYKVGDFCVCLTLDRSIHNIEKGKDYTKKGNYIESDGKDHNISNCIAFVGFEL